MMVRRASLPSSQPASRTGAEAPAIRRATPADARRATALPLGTVDPARSSRTNLPTAMGADDELDDNVW